MDSDHSTMPLYAAEMFKHTDQGYVVIDISYDQSDKPVDIYYVESNPAANRMTGVQLAGKHLSELGEAYEQHWFEIFGRVAVTGVAERHTLPANPLGVIIQFYAFKVGTAQQRRIAVIYEDVTQRLQAEEVTAALKKSEEQFRMFVTASSVMAYRMSADWKQMYTLNGQNILADTDPATASWVDKYIPEIDQTLVWQHIIQAINAKDNFELEHRIVQANGAIGWVHSHAIPVFNATGDITEWLGAGIDITTRKQAEADLLANQQRQNFMLILSDALRPLSKPLDIQETASRVLGEYLQAARVVYVEVTETEYIIERDYVNGVASMAGRYPLQRFGQGKLADYADGKTRVVYDTRADQHNSSADAANFEMIGVRAGIGVPLVKDGKFVMALVVHMDTTRDWSATEISLVEETAERTWAAVERAKAEAALRDSELTRQIALEAFHIGMATWYPQNDQLDADRQFHALFGLNPNDPVNREIGHKRLVHPDDKEHHASMINKALDPAGNGKLYDEYRVIHTDGSIHWLATTGQTIFERNPAVPARMFVMLQDITERKRAEEALHTSEQRVKSIIDLVPDLLWESEPGGSTTWFNRRWLEYTGQSLDQATNWGWKNAIHPDDRDESAQRYADALNAGRPLQQEHRIQRHDGQYRWFVVSTLPVKDYNGGLVRIYGAATDIHARKQSEEEQRETELRYRAQLEKEVRERTADLKASRDELQSMFDTTLIQMSILEGVRSEEGELLDLTIRAANKELEKETGRTDLVGKLYGAEYPRIREVGIFELIKTAISTGLPHQMEYDYSHEGVQKWYTCSFIKLGDGVVATNLDITERKTAEELRLKNLLLLEQSERVAKIGTWDHDLLTGLYTWSDGMYRQFEIAPGTEMRPEVYIELATPETRSAAERIVDHILTGDQEFEETLEIEVNGLIKVLRIKATVVRDEQGQPIRVLGVDLKFYRCAGCRAPPTPVRGQAAAGNLSGHLTHTGRRTEKNIRELTQWRWSATVWNSYFDELPNG
jgi:PAS domain S-box-containing protein